ncbi:MAG TPA: hypothetical protein VIA18_01225 [Polyangia bacterium]|jgi:hypothetical protein|nr:hypothetical protein [Polyangia bacterium]
MQSSLLQSDLATKRASSTTATGSLSGLTTPTTTPATSTSSNALGSAAVSSFAQFLSKLQNLAQTNPTKEKSVLNDIASKLQTQAQASGGDAGQRLSQMADRFSQAAQTGDLSALQSKTPSGNGGATSRALSSYQQNSGVDQSLMDVLNSEQL